MIRYSFRFGMADHNKVRIVWSPLITAARLEMEIFPNNQVFPMFLFSRRENILERVGQLRISSWEQPERKLGSIESASHRKNQWEFMN